MQQGNWWGRGAALLTCVTLGACSMFGSHPLRAGLTLRPTQGNTAHGVVALAERGDSVQVTYNIVGLAPNTQHTFVIHVGGDCSGANASDAGPRFQAADLPPVSVNPNHSAEYPADRTGRLTQIWADANGVAMGFFVLPGVTLDGVRSIVGRTMVIHDGVDEWDDDSSGSTASDDAGAALACGIISR